MAPTFGLALITVAAILADLGLAILGWGGFAAFLQRGNDPLETVFKGQALRLGAPVYDLPGCAAQHTGRQRASPAEPGEFAPDSPLEGDGFEPSVPLRHRKAKSNDAGSKNVVPLTGDRGFESLFLQRGVRCE